MAIIPRNLRGGHRTHAWPKLAGRVSRRPIVHPSPHHLDCHPNPLLDELMDIIMDRRKS